MTQQSLNTHWRYRCGGGGGVTRVYGCSWGTMVHLGLVGFRAEVGGIAFVIYCFEVINDPTVTKHSLEI